MLKTVFSIVTIVVAGAALIRAMVLHSKGNVPEATYYLAVTILLVVSWGLGSDSE